MYKEKTDFEKALERFQGYNSAFAHRDIQDNLTPLWKRAEEISDRYDFITFDAGAESTNQNRLKFSLEIFLGSKVEARISVAYNMMGDFIEFSIYAPTTRESASSKTQANGDNLLVASSKDPDGIFNLEPQFVNPDYIDYLVTKAVEYLNKEITRNEIVKK